MKNLIKVMPILLLVIYTAAINIYLRDYLIICGLNNKDCTMVTIVALLGFAIGALSIYLANRVDNRD